MIKTEGGGIYLGSFEARQLECMYKKCLELYWWLRMKWKKSALEISLKASIWSVQFCFSDPADQIGGVKPSLKITSSRSQHHTSGQSLPIVVSGKLLGWKMFCILIGGENFGGDVSVSFLLSHFLHTTVQLYSRQTPTDNTQFLVLNNY